MAEGREDLLRVLGYSEKAIEYIATDRNFGKLAGATVDAHHQGHRGDILKTYLKVEGGIIRGARFEHMGCMGLQASASFSTRHPPQPGLAGRLDPLDEALLAVG